MWQLLGIFAMIGAALYPKKAVEVAQSASTIGYKVGTEVFGPFLQTVKSVVTGETFGPFQPVDAKEKDILARTIWGEARGEGYYGMQAVASVMINRLSWTKQHNNKWWWGSNIIGICKNPSQFNCWMPTDANYQKLLKVTAKDDAFNSALDIANDALRGALRDVTGGADTYYAVGTRNVPSATIGRKQTAKIGNHVFFYTEGGMAVA